MMEVELVAGLDKGRSDRFHKELVIAALAEADREAHLKVE